MDNLASAYRRLPTSWKYALFQRRFGSAIDPRSGLDTLPILQPLTHDDPYFASLEKDNSRVILSLNLQELFNTRRYFNAYWKRLPLMIGFFTRTDPQVRNAIAEFSDGGDFGNATMCFCSNRPDAALVPDATFMRQDAYRIYRRVAMAYIGNWHERKNVVLWRGAASDYGDWEETELNESNLRLKPRVRMCVKLRDVPNADAKITRVPAQGAALDRLRRHGLIGAPVPQENWIGYKFAIDIDGGTNAWSNLFVRFILGCCVLKVASPRGYRQWYYDELVPGQHYVPVRADMTDLNEKIEWCRTHDAECRAIASAGQEFALRRTVESETVLTVRRLNIALAERQIAAQSLADPVSPGSST